MFIAGAGNDAGGFQAIAEILADVNTVVTYDRRGLSRSPRGDGWTQTSIEEQADDAAALIAALDLDRPIVFGSSLGGTIVVSLLERHATSARGAIAHEPGLSWVAPSFSTFMSDVQQVVADVFAEGPDAIFEAVARFITGDDAFDALDAEVLAGLRANGEVSDLEIAAQGAFRPTAEAIAAAGVPIHAAHGEATPHAWFIECAEWVSRASGGPLHVFPGGHAGYVDRPRGFADALRPILESMS